MQPHQKSKKSHDTTIFSFSHSSLETMAKCDRAFYYQYIEQLYPEEQPNYATQYGSFVHKIAENYFGGGEKELNRLYFEYKDEFTINAEYKAKLPLSLKRVQVFYDFYLKNSSLVLREKEYRYPLDKFIDVTGKIDLIFRDTEISDIIVADYKTGKKFGNPFEQFAFYYSLLSKMKNKTPESLRFMGVYLCAGEGIEIHDFVKPVTLDKSDLEITESRIDNAIDKILTLGVDDIEKWKKKVGPLCSWCKYQQNIGDCICNGNGKGKRIN